MCAIGEEWSDKFGTGPRDKRYDNNHVAASANNLIYNSVQEFQEENSFSIDNEPPGRLRRCSMPRA